MADEKVKCMASEDVSGSINQEELQRFRREWHDQIARVMNNVLNSDRPFFVTRVTPPDEGELEDGILHISVEVQPVVPLEVIQLNFIIPPRYCECGWQINRDVFEVVWTPRGLRRVWECPDCGKKLR